MTLPISSISSFFFGIVRRERPATQNKFASFQWERQARCILLCVPDVLQSTLLVKLKTDKLRLEVFQDNFAELAKTLRIPLESSY